MLMDREWCLHANKPLQLPHANTCWRTIMTHSVSVSAICVEMLVLMRSAFFAAVRCGMCERNPPPPSYGIRHFFVYANLLLRVTSIFNHSGL